MKYFTKTSSIPKALMWATGGAVPGAAVGAVVSKKDKKLLGAATGAIVGAAAGVGAGHATTAAIRSKLMRGSGMVPTANTEKMRTIEKHVIGDMDQVYKNISNKYLKNDRIASPLGVIKANKGYNKNKHKMSLDMLESIGVDIILPDKIKFDTIGKPKYFDIHNIPPKYTKIIRYLREKG